MDGQSLLSGSSQASGAATEGEMSRNQAAKQFGGRSAQQH